VRKLAPAEPARSLAPLRDRPAPAPNPYTSLAASDPCIALHPIPPADAQYYCAAVKAEADARVRTSAAALTDLNAQVPTDAARAIVDAAAIMAWAYCRLLFSLT